MRPFIAFIFFALAAPVAAQPGPVVISELMWSGSTASTADEWIELYNASNAAIDLVGWTLTYRSGDEDKVMFVLDAAVIPAGQTFLIANYAANHKNSLLAVEPQRVDAAVSLPNTKLLLQLYDGDPQAGGQLIDVADDGRGAPFAGDSASKSAMVRIAFDQPGDQPESWRLRPNKAAGMRVPASWARRGPFLRTCSRMGAKPWERTFYRCLGLQ